LFNEIQHPMSVITERAL